MSRARVGILPLVHSSKSSPRSASALSTSRAENGSSRHRSSGSMAMARANPTFWRMPPDNSRGYAVSKPSSPTRSSRSSALAVRILDGMPRALRGTSTFSRTVSQGNRANVWKTIEARGFTPLSGNPRYSTRPSEGFCRPVMMRKSVLLPQPEGPRRATNSPSATVRLTRDTALKLRLPVP